MPAATRRRMHVVEAIEASGVVAVVRLREDRAAVDAIEALVAGGVVAVEVTMTVPDAARLIETLRTNLPVTVLVGAGTVLDAGTAARVIDAGAQFVVSPVFHPETLAVCQARDIAVVPGCFTPTEILAAWNAGADIVKVFPAGVLGPAFVRDVRAPLPQVRLMPTGGVTVENAGAWIRAGACAVGVGTALVDPALVSAGRFDDLTRSARRFVDAVRGARAEARS